MHLVAASELLEIAREHTVAVEVEHAARVGEHEAEVASRVDVGDLAQCLVLDRMERLSAAVLELALVLGKLVFRDAERLVDGVVQVGGLEFVLQVVRLWLTTSSLPGTLISIRTTGGILRDVLLARWSTRTRQVTSRSKICSSLAIRARISSSAHGMLSRLWKAISTGTCTI
jgi:ABC-type transporter Mla MlaB component